MTIWRDFFARSLCVLTNPGRSMVCGSRRRQHTLALVNLDNAVPGNFVREVARTGPCGQDWGIMCHGACATSRSSRPGLRDFLAAPAVEGGFASGSRQISSGEKLFDRSGGFGLGRRCPARQIDGISHGHRRVLPEAPISHFAPASLYGPFRTDPAWAVHWPQRFAFKKQTACSALPV